MFLIQILLLLFPNVPGAFTMIYNQQFTQKSIIFKSVDRLVEYNFLCELITG